MSSILLSPLGNSSVLFKTLVFTWSHTRPGLSSAVICYYPRQCSCASTYSPHQSARNMLGVSSIAFLSNQWKKLLSFRRKTDKVIIMVYWHIGISSYWHTYILPHYYTDIPCTFILSYWRFILFILTPIQYFPKFLTTYFLNSNSRSILIYSWVLFNTHFLYSVLILFTLYSFSLLCTHSLYSFTQKPSL